MDLKEAAKGLALQKLEELGLELVELGFDEVLEQVKTAIKNAIPGQMDDAVVEMIMAPVGPALKAGLLAQIAKIKA